MSALKWTFCVCLLSRCLDCSASEEMKTRPGREVLLQCHSPTEADIKLVKWTKPDLKSESYVFFFREERIYDDNQHPSFRNRVEMKDQQMKGGDISVILKNVTMNDTGTYECYFGYRGSSELISSIHLKVEDSGHNKDEGNKDEEDKDEEDKTAYVDLVIPAVFSVFGLVIIWIIKKPLPDRPLVYKPI